MFINEEDFLTVRAYDFRYEGTSTFYRFALKLVFKKGLELIHLFRQPDTLKNIVSLTIRRHTMLCERKCPFKSKNPELFNMISKCV